MCSPSPERPSDYLKGQVTLGLQVAALIRSNIINHNVRNNNQKCCTLKVKIMIFMRCMNESQPPPAMRLLAHSTHLLDIHETPHYSVPDI